MTHKNKKTLHKENKAAKSSNTTVSQEDIAITKPEKRVWLEEYKEYFTHRMQPVTQAFLERISNDLLLYAETTQDLLRVDAFFLKKRISPETVKGWKERYPEFKLAYMLARRMLAMRKEDKFLNSAIVMNTMGRDDDEYDAWLIAQAKLKKDTEEDRDFTVLVKEIKRQE